ncbi:MAG: hypothetical protein CENE_02262 [Candidatus Celerinatantimonas neptuna]|nr:MAG: hypothetical protein CENE_02262 [Candidatus Celerinatantimonas neptuna]
MTQSSNDSTTPQWQTDKAYTKGEKISYLGINYIAAFWTQGDSPDQHYGEYGQPWKKLTGEVKPQKNNSTKNDTKTSQSGNPTSNRHLPDKMMVGYVDTTAIGACAAITEEQLTSYNVIIFGFTKTDGTLSADTLDTIQKLRQKMSHNPIQLISTGGAAGKLDLTENSITNLHKLIQEHSFDGIDLDLEESEIEITQLKKYIQSLKKTLNGEYVLTIAPILAGSPQKPVLRIPNGGPSLASIYEDIPFDAILVQAYNSGLNFKYPKPGTPSQLVDESSADIIAASYNSLHQTGDIHSDSLIVIGIPSNGGGAPSQSNLWNSPDLSAVTHQIKSNFNEICDGEHAIDPIQFGGLMCWSLCTDAFPSAYHPYNGYENGPAGYFAEQVASLIKTH